MMIIKKFSIFITVILLLFMGMVHGGGAALCLLALNPPSSSCCTMTVCCCAPGQCDCDAHKPLSGELAIYDASCLPDSTGLEISIELTPVVTGVAMRPILPLENVIKYFSIVTPSLPTGPIFDIFHPPQFV